MGLRESIRIMIVDDMSTSRAILSNALDEIGIVNYVLENDGRAALAKLAAAPVHLVLSDMNMPNLDGLGLLKALRENRTTQRIGFVLVTGKPTPDIIQRAQSLGANNLLKKPFTTDTMKQCIERVVGRL